MVSGVTICDPDPKLSRANELIERPPHPSNGRSGL